MGYSWGTVGAQLGHIIVFPWVHLGHTWGTVGAKSYLGHTWGTLGADAAGAQLGHTWAHLGQSWGKKMTWSTVFVNCICPKCAPSNFLPQLCPNCAPSVPQVCPRKYNFVPQVFPNYAPTVPQLCLARLPNCLFRIQMLWNFLPFYIRNWTRPSHHFGIWHRPKTNSLRLNGLSSPQM